MVIKTIDDRRFPLKLWWVSILSVAFQNTFLALFNKVINRILNGDNRLALDLSQYAGLIFDPLKDPLSFEQHYFIGWEFGLSLEHILGEGSRELSGVRGPRRVDLDVAGRIVMERTAAVEVVYADACGQLAGAVMWLDSMQRRSRWNIVGCGGLFRSLQGLLGLFHVRVFVYLGEPPH